MLRRLSVLGVAVLLALSTAGLSACQKAPTRDEVALKAANVQVDTYNEGYVAAFDALGALKSSDRSQAGWARRAELLAGAEAWMPKRRAALEAATAEWRKVAGMDVSTGTKRYAALMSELLPVKLREEAKTSEILAASRELCEYLAAGKTEQSVVGDKAAAIGKLDKEAVDISAEVFAKQKEAARCSNGIGSFFRTWAENPSDY